MFVSAGTNLKFHNWPLEIVYKPIGLGDITALSWSKDNSFLTFISESGHPEIISLKDPENIKNVHTISAVADASAIAFQRTTKRCIGFATNSGQVALYDTKNKCISKLFQPALCSVNLLEFNAEDTQMAVSCVNGNISLYDPKRGNVMDTYIASKIVAPTTMMYHPSEKHILAVGANDGTVLQWDTNTSLTRFCAKIHNGPITGLVILQNSDLMLSVGTDHKFSIHDLTGECVFSSNQQFPLTAVDVSSDGVTIAVGSAIGNISVYDVRKLIKPLTTCNAHNSKINKISYERSIKYDTEKCDDNLISCQSNHDISAKDEKLNCEIKYSEKQFKCSPADEKKNPIETITMKSIKQELADSINKSASELQTHLMTQFGSLHMFVANEFRTINEQMEQKWDILNIPKKMSTVRMHDPDKEDAEHKNKI